MILLSLLVAVLIGRGEPTCEVSWIHLLSDPQVTLPSDLHTKPLIEIFGEKDKMNCTRYNTEENLTYALKALHNGTAVDVDSIGCFEDPSSIIGKTYFYKKGESKRTLFTFPNTVDFFCAIPIDRTCENPFKLWDCGKSSVFHCPTFTKGSDREAAKLECADNKWRINNKNQVITAKPVCKRDAKNSGPSFYIKLPSGGEARVDGRSTRCYKNADDTDPVEQRTASNRYGTSSSRSSSNPVPIIVISVVIIGSIALCCGVGIAVCVVVKKNNKRRAQQFANMYPPYGQQAGNYPRQQYPPQQYQYPPVQSVNESAASDPSVKEEPANGAVVHGYMPVPQ